MNTTVAAWYYAQNDSGSALEQAILDDHSNVGGIYVGLITVAFTVCVELLSYKSVLQVLKQNGGKRLYATAVFCACSLTVFPEACEPLLSSPLTLWRVALRCLFADNCLNNLCLGPGIWAVAVGILCRPTQPHASERAFKTVGLLIVHSIGYCPRTTRANLTRVPTQPAAQARRMRAARVL